LGNLSDKIGRRPVLIISIISTAIGWIVFAFARSVPILFLGRIIDGIAAGNFPIAQSYMSDLSKDGKERASNMGLIGAAFGIGFIIGPSIGAALGAISHKLPFLVVGVLAALNALGAYFFLPETNIKIDKNKKISINPFLPIKKAVKDLELRPFFLTWFIFGTALAVYQSLFALFLNESFGLGTQAAGFIFTGVGVFMVINQGFAMRHFWLKKFKPSELSVWLFLFMTIGFLMMSVNFLVVFSLGLITMTITSSVLRASISGQVAGIAGQSKQGETLGIMSSVMSLSMIVGPAIGGLFFKLNSSLPFFVSAILTAICFIIMRSNHKKYEPKPNEPIIVAETL
jgi:predicted MFS family arabinose efflux permease